MHGKTAPFGAVCVLLAFRPIALRRTWTCISHSMSWDSCHHVTHSPRHEPRPQPCFFFSPPARWSKEAEKKAMMTREDFVPRTTPTVHMHAIKPPPGRDWPRQSQIPLSLLQSPSGESDYASHPPRSNPKRPNSLQFSNSANHAIEAPRGGCAG